MLCTFVYSLFIIHCACTVVYGIEKMGQEGAVVGPGPCLIFRL